MYILTDALRVYSTLDDAALMRSRSQVRRRQARGSASSSLPWKPSARLRVHRRASLSRSRRRGPSRGEFDVGGGTSMEASARSRRPPPSTDTVPTQDAADSEAAACDRRWCRRCSRPGVQAAEFDPRSPSWSPRIDGPGVQAEAMHIQNGCRTHPGGPSVRARVGDRSMPWSSWRACTADNCMPVMREHTHREPVCQWCENTHTESQFSCLLHSRW